MYEAVNPDTVEIGSAGAGPTRHESRDVDRAGVHGMVFVSMIKETGIGCGDEEATLAGATYAGSAGAGTDVIVT